MMMAIRDTEPRLFRLSMAIQKVKRALLRGEGVSPLPCLKLKYPGKDLSSLQT